MNATWNTDHPKKCVDHIWVDACIQPYGDIIWVKDNYADDRSVGVLWEDLDGPREGRCYDFLSANADWTACNKDFPEGHEIRWTVGYVNLETNAWVWEACLRDDQRAPDCRTSHG